MAKFLRCHARYCMFMFNVYCSLIIDSSVFAEGEAEAAVKAELGEEAGLVEEDLVAVSYMGDELDLETVGDIIAIIEEKVCAVLIYKRLHVSFPQRQTRSHVVAFSIYVNWRVC